MEPSESQLRQEVADLSASVLEAEFKTLQNSNVHLRQSIAELKQAMQEERDPEYKAAIEENIVLIAKQEARMELLRAEILAARGGKVYGSEAPASIQTGAREPEVGRTSGANVEETAQAQAGSAGMDVDSAAPAAGNGEEGAWL